MKVGIIGAGGIANTVAQTLVQMKEIECYAVASRSLEKAEEFAKKFNFEKAYGSYEELVKDEKVELVYIATPHSHHYDHMMMAIEHKKPVLCEKAFTINAKQAKEIKVAAKKNHVFVAEAIWTRYMPSRAMIQELIDGGIIGKVNTLTANLSYAISHRQRLIDPNLAGGALLDIGVYGINFAFMHFGTDIERVESSVHMNDTGIDDMETITLFYKDNRMAVLTHSIYARSDRKGIIHGEKGYIIVENINNPQSISVYDYEDNLIQHMDVPKQISGYEYQFQECAKAIEKGKSESSSMSLDDTIYVMEFMDSLRKEWGLVYPQELKL